MMMVPTKTLRYKTVTIKYMFYPRLFKGMGYEHNLNIDTYWGNQNGFA